MESFGICFCKESFSSSEKNIPSNSNCFIPSFNSFIWFLFCCDSLWPIGQFISIFEFIFCNSSTIFFCSSFFFSLSISLIAWRCFILISTLFCFKILIISNISSVVIFLSVVLSSVNFFNSYSENSIPSNLSVSIPFFNSNGNFLFTSYNFLPQFQFLSILNWIIFNSSIILCCSSSGFDSINCPIEVLLDIFIGILFLFKIFIISIICSTLTQ